MKIFVIIDGLGDLPVPELSGKTPLEAAHIPYLNYFARAGRNGFVYAIGPRVAPESDAAVLALLGYDALNVYTGRGPLEALGAGVDFDSGNLVLRTNFATVSFGRVVDRRAGRGLTTREARVLEKAINSSVKLSVPFVYKSTVQHRGVIIFKGRFSSNESNIDPAYEKVGHIGVAHDGGDIIHLSEPLDKSVGARRAADVVNEFMKQSMTVLSGHPLNAKREKKGLLAANALLMRDGGIRLPTLSMKKGWTAVLSMPLEIGLARRCGMNVVSFDYPEMKTSNVYDNLYAGLRSSIAESKKAIRRGLFENYYIHFKEIDVCGHDGNFREKVKMLELVDKKFFSFVRKIKDVELIVTGDHSTPCVRKRHTDDPVPLLWYGHGADGVTTFSENGCKKGSLGKMLGKDVLRRCGF